MGQNFYTRCAKDELIGMPNLAALRAAIFLISAKNQWGHICAPAVRGLMAHNLCSGFAIQNTFMSTVILFNEVSELLQRHYLLSAILPTSLSTFAQLPTLRSNIFFNEGTAGVLGNN